MKIDLEELTKSLEKCVELQSGIDSNKDQLCLELIANNKLMERFLMSNCKIFNPKNTHYSIDWCKNKFHISVYFDYDSAYAGSETYEYEKLMKFAERENAREEIYGFLEDWKDEEHLQVMYDILRERFE